MDLFAALGALPILLFVGAVVLTFVLQSSTASIAVGIGLAAGGQVTATMLFPLGFSGRMWVYASRCLPPDGRGSTAVGSGPRCSW